MITQYVWIPSNQNEKASFVSNSLLESIKAVATSSTYGVENLPRGRVMFVGIRSENRAFIDETSLYRTVNNANLTDVGFEAFLYTNNFNHYVNYVRFPSKGYLVNIPIPESLLNQGYVWFHINTLSIRNEFSDTISVVENLSTSLYNRARLRDVFNTVEDGHVTTQSVHLIPDEIPASLRFIEQSGSQWHKAVSLNKPAKLFLTMKLANDSSMSALTDPISLRYLAITYTTLLHKDMSHNDAMNEIKNLKTDFENNSITDRQVKYINYYNTLLTNHRQDFFFIGNLHWIATEDIHTVSPTDILFL
jgi:hypothetical protein